MEIVPNAFRTNWSAAPVVSEISGPQRRVALALTKENIINEVYETTQLPKNRSREVVETALELMKGTLSTWGMTC